MRYRTDNISDVNFHHYIHQISEKHSDKCFYYDTLKSFFFPFIPFHLLIFSSLECLSGFLKTRDGTKCPICRAPVDSSDPPIPPPRPSPRPPGGDGGGGGGGSGSSGSGGSCSAESFSQDQSSSSSAYTRSSTTNTSTNNYDNSSTYDSSAPLLGLARTAEINYRMQRMRYLYPQVCFFSS